MEGKEIMGWVFIGEKKNKRVLLFIATLFILLSLFNEITNLPLDLKLV